jgi:hypothetical protein
MAESLSKVTELDGKQIKLPRSTIDKLQADVDGPKRFYTQQWLDDYLKRMTVVTRCECGEPMVAEEVDSHPLKHVRPSIRPILRMFVDLSAKDQQAVRDYVTATRGGRELSGG